MPTARVFRRLRQQPPAMLGLGLVVALVLFALFGPWLLEHQPNHSDFSLGRGATGAPPGPSAEHLLGTDPLFRDLLARLAAGARLSLLVAVGATAIAVTIGALVGVVAGYAECRRPVLRASLGGRAIRLPLGWLDDALMRLVDVALAFPFLLLVTAVGVAVDRTDASTVLLILGLTGWIGIARIVRSKTMQLGRSDYVASAIALGASAARVIGRHLLPGLAGTLLVIATHLVAQMILAEAVLSYLTVGIGPPEATWGRMLHEAEHYLSIRPSLPAASGFAILLAVLGFTRLGDGLRDALEIRSQPEPRLRAHRLPIDVLIVTAAFFLVALAEPSPPADPIGPSASLEAEPHRGGVLRLATSVDTRSLDPALAYDELSTAVGQHIFARLVHWDEQGRLRPELAERMQSSRGGRRHTFWLRPGLRFHDGAPVRAQDVKRSLERTLHPSAPCPGASLYRMIAGYEAFARGEAEQLAGVEVVDERTIRIDLSEPDATFLPVMTLGFAAPVCPSVPSRIDPKRPAAPCGAGAFVLDTWHRGERIALRRFEAYHRPELPYLDGIVWHLNLPSHSQRYRFEAGELDCVRELTSADIALYRAQARWAPYAFWSTKHVTHGVFLNTEIPPFDNRHLRRAVAHALDPSVLPKVRPQVTPTDRMVPESIPGPSRAGPMRRYDPAAALVEMRRAGYPYEPATDGGGYPEIIDYVTVPDQFPQAAAEIFQQQLARVGIRVRLKLVSYASWLSQTAERRAVAMGWDGWHADFPDPSNFFDPILTTSGIRQTGSQNRSFFSSPVLDALIARARLEQDLEERMRLYLRAEQLVRDEAPWIPLYAARAYELTQPRVRGYRPHPVLPQRYTEVWLSPRGQAEGMP